MSTETVAGVWQRQFEEDPIGDVANADRDTLVFWTQAPKSGIYVDIRLPKGSLGRNDRTVVVQKHPLALQAHGMSLDDVSTEDLSILLRQKSFAGTLEFSLGDTTETKEALAKDSVLVDLAEAAADNPGALPLCTCFWKREIDYQPPSGGLDIGVCASAPPNSDGSIHLRETGDDGSYAEGWHRLVGSEHGPYFACQLLTENGMDRRGYWVRTGNYFAYAVGRPKDATTAEILACSSKSQQIQGCVGTSLGQAVQDLVGSDSQEQLSLLGTYVCVFGEIVSTEDGSEWNILHSTDPRLVGCKLLGSTPDCCSTITWESSERLQQGDLLCQTVELATCIRQWQVLEVDDPSTMMKSLHGLS